MLNKFFGGGTIKRFVRSLLTTDKTVSTAGLYAADAKSIKDLMDKIEELHTWQLLASTNNTSTTSFTLPKSILDYKEVMLCTSYSKLHMNGTTVVPHEIIQRAFTLSNPQPVQVQAVDPNNQNRTATALFSSSNLMSVSLTTNDNRWHTLLYGR